MKRRKKYCKPEDSVIAWRFQWWGFILGYVVLKIRQATYFIRKPGGAGNDILFWLYFIYSGKKKKEGGGGREKDKKKAPSHCWAWRWAWGQRFSKIWYIYTFFYIYMRCRENKITNGDQKMSPKVLWYIWPDSLSNPGWEAPWIEEVHHDFCFWKKMRWLGDRGKSKKIVHTETWKGVQMAYLREFYFQLSLIARDILAPHQKKNLLANGVEQARPFTNYPHVEMMIITSYHEKSWFMWEVERLMFFFLFFPAK